MKKDELRKILEKMPQMNLIELFKQFSDGGEGRFWYANVFENYGQWYEAFDAPEEAVEPIKADFEENIGDMQSPVRYSMGKLEVVDIDDVYFDCYHDIDNVIGFMWVRRSFDDVREVIDRYELSEYFQDFKSKSEIENDLKIFIREREMGKFNLSANWYSDFRKWIAFEPEKELYFANNEDQYYDLLKKLEDDFIRWASGRKAKQDLEALLETIQNKYTLPKNWFGSSVIAIDVLGADNPYFKLQYALINDEEYKDVLKEIESILNERALTYKKGETEA